MNINSDSIKKILLILSVAAIAVFAVFVLTDFDYSFLTADLSVDEPDDPETAEIAPLSGGGTLPPPRSYSQEFNPGQYLTYPSHPEELPFFRRWGDEFGDPSKHSGQSLKVLTYVDGIHVPGAQINQVNVDDIESIPPGGMGGLTPYYTDWMQTEIKDVFLEAPEEHGGGRFVGWSGCDAPGELDKEPSCQEQTVEELRCQVSITNKQTRRIEAHYMISEPVLPLQLWSVSNNELTGGIPPTIWEILEPQIAFKSANQADGHLQGGIPDTIAELPSLQLNIGRNYLDGEIPEATGDMENIEWLGFYLNRLTGEIPAALGNLGDTLRYLLLYDQVGKGGGLTGTLPRELGDLTKLVRFEIHDNFLEGIIPKELADISLLIPSEMRFFNNRFEGAEEGLMSDSVWEGVNFNTNRIGQQAGEDILWDAAERSGTYIDLCNNDVIGGRVDYEIGGGCKDTGIIDAVNAAVEAGWDVYIPIELYQDYEWWDGCSSATCQIEYDDETGEPIGASKGGCSPQQSSNQKPYCEGRAECVRVEEPIETCDDIASNSEGLPEEVKHASNCPGCDYWKHDECEPRCEFEGQCTQNTDTLECDESYPYDGRDEIEPTEEDPPKSEDCMDVHRYYEVPPPSVNAPSSSGNRDMIDPAEEIPIPVNKLNVPLDPCPNPPREPRFVYREKVIHEERQFRPEHTGCGGDILVRKWQRVVMQAGYCTSAECRDPQWLDPEEGGYVQIHERFVPGPEGKVFEEVGSWQKAWPSSVEDGHPKLSETHPQGRNQWKTEKQLKDEFGEPVPFPVCQSDCVQPPPGVPDEIAEFKQEDPYYFNNPWLPEIVGGERSDNIELLREKNLLAGMRSIEDLMIEKDYLDTVSLPVKLFWWNVPGWHEGWVEDGEDRFCEGPEDIACVHHYIIRFDNINREDRPAEFHRHEVIYWLTEEHGLDYNEAQNLYTELKQQNHRAYVNWRIEEKDRTTTDVMRYDRDNIVGCDDCGAEKEIWLDTNTFNPLEFEPVYEYDRPHRDFMKEWLLERFENHEHSEALEEIIEEVYDSYGRPGFFRSGAEHTYTLQAACKQHDFLEENMDRWGIYEDDRRLNPEGHHTSEDKGRWGYEGSFSSQASDAPELISPIDPNWVSPYDPLEYDPYHDYSRLRADAYDYPDGYRYPAELYGLREDYDPDDPSAGPPVVGPPDTGPTVPPEDPPTDTDPETGITEGPPVEDSNNPGMECSTSGLGRTDPPSEEVKDIAGVDGRNHGEVYENWLKSQEVNSTVANRIAWAGGSCHTIPPLFEEGDHLHCWRKMLSTADVLEDLHVGGEADGFIVTSAYRDLACNNAVGSTASTSYHMRNMATDIQSTRGGLRGPNKDLYWHLDAILPSGTGRLEYYPPAPGRGAFVHIDTRSGGWRSHINNEQSPIYEEENPLLSLEDNNFSSRFSHSQILDGEKSQVLGESVSGTQINPNAYMKEEYDLQEWLDEQDNPFKLWDQAYPFQNLVLQDQVPFREELRWIQQWYHLRPERRPVPASTYQLKFGSGFRVNLETISRFGQPVLETCHPQFVDSFHVDLGEEELVDLPVCIYKRRVTEGHETQHIYPEPNLRDSEMEFFTLPQEEEVDIYSWNVATCRDSGQTDCTDFSQMWRLQLDEREDPQFFPPRNDEDVIKNMRNPWVDEDDATMGFPLRVAWERRFGARSYVYRIAREGVDWESDPYEAMDAEILRGHFVRYEIDELDEDGLFDLDEEYVWDIKACRDDHIEHDKETPRDILEWADEHKECTDWRSETHDDAPFEFKTTGRAPTELYSPEPIGLLQRASYPLRFDWEEVPGAKSYAIRIYDPDLSPGFDPFPGWEFDLVHEGILAIVPESEFFYYREILLNEEYDYEIYTCADKVPDIEYWFLTQSWEERKEDLHCGDESLNGIITPTLFGPPNLSPGGSPERPVQLPMEESIQTITWSSLEEVDYYWINIEKVDEPTSLTQKAYAQNEEFPKIVDTNSFVYDFPEIGTYEIEVKGCLMVEDGECLDGALGWSVPKEHYTPGVENRPRYVELVYDVQKGGIVPCGRETNIFSPEEPVDSRDDCRPVHFFVFIGLFIEEILVKILIPYSLIILLIYTGYLYYTGLGKPETMKRVFKIWNYALKGYLLIFLAWFIIGIFLTMIGYQFGVWWQITINL